MEFIIAGLIFIATLVWCFIIDSVNNMSDAPSNDTMQILPWFLGGVALAMITASTHWWL